MSTAAPRHGVSTKASSARASNTVIIGKATEATTLDPAKITAATDCELCSLVYEQLIGMDGSAHAVPMLASSWSVSSNGLVYHFKIRKGVKFSNGRLLTPADVVWSLKRIQDPATGSSGAGYIPTGTVFSVEGTSGVKAVLKARAGGFLPILARACFSILPSKEIVAGTLNPKLQTLGTGPFQVTNHVQSQEWDLAARSDYWGGKPRFAKLVLKIMPSDAARVAALRSGEIDLSTFDVPNVQAVLTGISNLQIYSQGSPDPWILTINRSQSPYNNLKFRQAISMALDRRQIRALAFSGFGTLTGAVPTVQTPYSLPFASLPYSQFNLAKAQTLIKQSGVSLPVNVKLLVTSAYPEIIAAAQVVKQQLAKISVNCQLVDVDIGTFIADTFAATAKFEIAFTWIGGFADPSNIMNTFAAIPGLTGGLDPTLKALAVKANAALGSKRVALYHQIDLYLDKQAYCDFIASHSITFAWRSDRLGGVTIPKTEPFNMRFKSVWKMYTK